MGMIVERFKGIEFVRISSLTRDQQQQVWTSFDQEKIIKIIKDKTLLNDCILYKDYVNWQTPPAPAQPLPSAVSEPLQHPLTKLAFK